MATLAQAPKTQKERVSLVLDFDKKQALEQLAQQENRSLNFVVIEMIDRELKRKQDEAEYQEYIKKSVLLAEKRLDEQGSDGLTREQVKSSVMANVREFLKNNK